MDKARGEAGGTRQGQGTGNARGHGNYKAARTRQGQAEDRLMTKIDKARTKARPR